MAHAWAPLVVVAVALLCTVAHCELYEPRVVGLRGRVPCTDVDRVECGAEGRKSHLELELTAFNAVGGGAEIAELPLVALGPPGLEGPHRLRAEDPLRCMRDDLCSVPLDRDWVVSARVSRQLNVYRTRAMLDHIPMAAVATDSDLGAAGISFANVSTLPAYGAGVPSIVDTRKRIFTHNGAGVPGCQASQPASEERVDGAGVCDVAWADELSADPLQPAVDAMRLHTCTGTFCPASGVAWPSDRLLQVHELGGQCSMRTVEALPEALFEVEVEVRNTRTGVVHSLYALAGHGRSHAIHRLGADSPNGAVELVMHVRAMPLTRRRGVEGTSMRDVSALMFCHSNHTYAERLQRPSTALPAGTAHHVPTGRHGQDGLLWYAVHSDAMAEYGRLCGQSGAQAESLLRESLSALQTYCYTPGALEACLRPALSPCAASARLNRFAVDPFAPRPAELLREELWDVERLRTYVADVQPAPSIVGSEALHRAVVHEPAHASPEFGMSNHTGAAVRIRLTLADTILQVTAEDRVARGVYAQRLDHSGSSCTLRAREHGGGGLLFRYCTPSSSGLITVDGAPARKPYVARVSCPSSMGGFVDGRQGLAVNAGNRSMADMSFTAPIGGPAGACTNIGMPLPFDVSPATEAAAAATMEAGGLIPWVGTCVVELFDGTYPSVAVGPVERIECFFGGEPHPLTGDLQDRFEPECSFFSQDPRCQSFIWVFVAIFALGGFGAAFVVLMAAAVRALRARRKRSSGDAMLKKKQ